MLRSLAFAALLAALAGCDPGSASSGAYEVTFRDTQGAAVSTARLAFEPPDAGKTTTGTYRHVSGLTLASSPDLEATGLADGTVAVSLDLEVADGGVGLVGPFRGDESNGVWTVGSIAGPRPGGSFRATRQ